MESAGRQVLIAAPGVRLERLSLAAWWRSLVAAEAAWLVFAAVQSPYRLPGGDAVVAFSFVQHLFGDATAISGYQAGLAYFETPFYAIGKVARAAGLETVLGSAVEPAMIAVGAILYAGIALAVTAWVNAALGFRSPALAALAALFGTPLFFFATFSPGQTHTVDAMLGIGVAALALAAYRAGWALPLVAATGALLGLAMTSRYFAVSAAAGLWLTLLLYRRFRAAAVLTAATTASFGLALLPIFITGVPLTGGGFGSDMLGFAPLSPLKMLFTNHRGIFVWTPLMLLGVIGLVRLIVRRPADRPFFVFVGLSGLILVTMYVGVPYWDSGWSFSNRYLTQLFPVAAIGFAGLLDWRPRIVGVLGAVAVGWSVYLGVSLVSVKVFPNDQKTHATTVAQPVLSGEVNPGEFAFGLWYRSPLLRALPFQPFDDFRPR